MRKLSLVTGVALATSLAPAVANVLSAERSAPAPSVDIPTYNERDASPNPWALTLMAESQLDSARSAEEIAQAVNQLKLAAAQDDAAALYRLGSLAMIGRGVPISPVDGFEYCKRAAELGYAPAQYQLAALYALGQGTAPDEEKAIYWGRKAIAQGNSKAKYSIGRLLLLREKTDERAEAVKLLNQASSEGVVEAAVLLAESYAAGLHGLEPNKEKAKSLLQSHAEAGDEQAKAALQKISATAPAGP